MSAEENIRIAQKGYTDFGRGDVAAIVDAMDDEIVWTTPDVGMSLGGTYKGKSGVADFFKQVAEVWDFKAFEPREYISSGDQVAVTGSYTAVARQTGRTMTADWCMVWKIRDGKVLRFQEYNDSAALRDALTSAATA